ncbi:hypothetical protein BOO86_21510 [Mycobacterium sp. CBMA 234]|uniref:hypothetical protein n=1 Tax=Mycolicibacterium sp. CBMA 234 TaxID=1918495 RepID=UPI0012DD14A3|nr:hypothetical protein [Mycolicibacterium sp. CBMA 234]MUL67065.1 hypothetical protein [Mycolicibacterium sp. CBMA 234]
MSVMSHGPGPSEYVSCTALELLDELRIKMMECRLVLQALPDEADLNFDELDQDLLAAQDAARLAYGAASLVHERAQLATRWGAGWSRPRAIFARHSAEVRNGANRVAPKPALSDRLERSLWQLPLRDRVQDVVGDRPRCAANVRATGLRCTGSVIYLGSGIVGAQCYSHASPHERDRYRARNDSLAAAQSDAYDRLTGRQRGAGERVSVRWLQHREGQRQWVNEIGEAIGTVG